VTVAFAKARDKNRRKFVTRAQAPPATCNNGVTNEWDTVAVIRRAQSTLIARLSCQT
jgi:hypothetical protein